MMFLRTLIAVLIFSAVPLISQASPDDMAIGIASDHIDITVGFTGSSIELFGDRRDVRSDIAIVVEGPEKNVTIWKKDRVMGTWMNRYNAKFKDMPVYYHYAISAETIDEKLKQVMQERAIGHEALFAKVNGKKAKKKKNIEVFQKALVEKSSVLGTYFEQPAKIKFFNDYFFRVSFPIPPSAPTGNYKIRSYLIKDGEVLEDTMNLLKVEQVGLNAFIYKSAHNYSFIYAVICIGIALFSGWLVSVLRVKP